MSYNYDRVAEVYDLHRKGGGPYLPILVSLARSSSAKRVLEIGSGTGNNSQAFVEAYPCALIGLDRSRGMLSRAAAKGLRGSWVQADAIRLPLADQTIDFVFGVLVLHHIVQLDVLVQQCFRVLRQGYAAFVTSPHDFIERHPMNRYFPNFAAIDKARFQSINQIRSAFAKAGFSQTGAERAIGETVLIDRAYLEKVRSKFISTYDLLPPNEYAHGLAQLQADIEAFGVLDIPLRWECATVWGRK